MVNQTVLVSISLQEETLPVGKLWYHNKHNKISTSFEYDQTWLNHREKFALEPALQLTTGSFHTQAGMHLFGSIGDSAPDRWGRILMRRAHLAKYKNQNTPVPTLSEIDYLLGVNDEARQGALRFSLPGSERTYLASKSEKAIPPLVYLPKLLTATEHLLEDQESTEDLQLLLAPGSSLGGARPKASIRDKDGSLAIAKFPQKNDELNVVLWEAVSLTLAKRAGIKTPDWHVENILNKPVLIIKRFDRAQNQRIPFLSAMSMIQAQDNEQHSYLELAYALSQQGASPKADKEELWRRIVFSIAINNTDDHLRNHGFIYERFQGWRLSPAYDINPTPTHIKPRILTTAIDLENTTACLDLALSVSEEFGLHKNKANEIIQQVLSAVGDWHTCAKHLGISKRECDWMESAFVRR